ncbi:MAG: hypothetical protein AB7O21_01155 [Gammaproteobacteria bacterium]
MQNAAPSRRTIAFAALLIGYVSHFAASLLLPEWRYVSIMCWFLALAGGAVYCAETLKRLRART